MLTIDLTQVDAIFVGREKELEYLSRYMAEACKAQEHRVHVLLNSPGIGKTTLIHHFGKIMEANGTGLFFDFLCSSNWQSSMDINRALIQQLHLQLRNKKHITEIYFKSSRTSPEIKQEYANFLKELQDSTRNPNFTTIEVISIFQKLANFIPVLLSVDEIQELQQTQVQLISGNLNNKSEPSLESGLHYFTRILKDLLRSKIFIILSGTRYHILQQIGYKIGSPIREKVKILMITRFSPEDLISYLQEVKRIIEKSGLYSDPVFISQILSFLHTFLSGFSGGHPRTVAKITEYVMQVLPDMNKTPNLNYEQFIHAILPPLERIFKETLLSQEIVRVIGELSKYTQFVVVKDWIVKNATTGLFLGRIPENSVDSLVNDEITDIVYTLQNLGIILQNGNFEYYITSYFHLLEFLRPFTAEHELFLKEILSNKIFKMICGNHAGFGFTFENIIGSLLFMGKIPQNKLPFGLNPGTIREIRTIKGLILWDTFKMQPNILYHTPDARATDFMVMQSDTLICIQITTQKQPSTKKIKDLENLIEELQNISAQFQYIKGWIISLFPIIIKQPLTTEIVIHSGDSLIELMEKPLYSRLISIKNEIQ
jgi:hypothetical protein